VASNPPTESRDQDLTTTASELWQLLVDYAKQETVDPIRGLGRFVSYGTGAMLLIGIAGIELTVALLRVLQTETGTTFTGNLSWIPYFITLLVASAVVYVALKAINRKTSRRSA
jgi:hypothetical protein